MSAKLVRQRKHSITEVIPPDVTRARAGAWLDVISPFTEWAGLKGDALRYRREQLRIQQEAALECLAASIQQKMKGKRIVAPLPPKIIVPALESASLESPSSPLIDWWANLLVTGATGTEIRPYLLNLMTTIGVEEVRWLSEIWSDFSSQPEFSSGRFNLPLRAAFNIRESIEVELAKIKTRKFKKEAVYLETMHKVLDKVAKQSRRSGVPARIAVVECELAENNGHRLSYWCGSSLDHVAIQVCLALRLIEQHEQKLEPNFSEHQIIVPDRFEKFLDLKFVVPSGLGIEFLKACSPAEAPSTSKADQRRST